MALLVLSCFVHHYPNRRVHVPKWPGRLAGAQLEAQFLSWDARHRLSRLFKAHVHTYTDLTQIPSMIVIYPSSYTAVYRREHVKKWPRRRPPLSTAGSSWLLVTSYTYLSRVTSSQHNKNLLLYNKLSRELLLCKHFPPPTRKQSTTARDTTATGHQNTPGEMHPNLLKNQRHFLCCGKKGLVSRAATLPSVTWLNDSATVKAKPKKEGG